MNYIFVDFEMHPISREFQAERGICRNEIIEFGAAILGDDLNEISSFKEYVRPSYVRSVYRKITDLTGITFSKLSGAMHFEEVLSHFVDWCFSFGGDFKVYAWSENDLEQVTKEIQLKKINIDERTGILLDNWIDFQQEYCNLVGLEVPVSLEKALNSIGDYFVGDMHDALWDARNTAALFKVTRDEEDFQKMLVSINRLINHEKDTGGCRLGDMIDFSKIAHA